MKAAPRPSLARGMVRAARNFRSGTLEGELRSKVKLALLDMLSCALRSLDTPAGRAVVRLAARHHGGPAGVIGTPLSVAAETAAFVNATLAHGLVCEDMHTASVSHLGVVVLPALLALAQQKTVRGPVFMDAVVAGYEAGAAIGRALMDSETVRVHRPTAVTGPLGAALAGSLLFDLDEDAAVSALSLAANAAAGLNEWARYGADDMYLQAGFAARNAVTSVELAAAGVRASETALEGEAGLFRALGRPQAAGAVQMFAGPRPEILNVYHKPAPACNYAQTASQAALALSQQGLRAGEIQGIEVRCPAAAIHYPGCSASGPFDRVLQAKMSIPFCVAAAVADGFLEEQSFRQLDRPEILPAGQPHAPGGGSRIQPGLSGSAGRRSGDRT